MLELLERAKSGSDMVTSIENMLSTLKTEMSCGTNSGILGETQSPPQSNPGALVPMVMESWPTLVSFTSNSHQIYHLKGTMVDSLECLSIGIGGVHFISCRGRR